MEVARRIHIPATLTPNDEPFVLFCVGDWESLSVGLYASE
jgi:hypothetical protein